MLTKIINLFCKKKFKIFYILFIKNIIEILKFTYLFFLLQLFKIR